MYVTLGVVEILAALLNRPLSLKKFCKMYVAILPRTYVLCSHIANSVLVARLRYQADVYHC